MIYFIESFTATYITTSNFILIKNNKNAKQYVTVIKSDILNYLNMIK